MAAVDGGARGSDAEMMPIVGFVKGGFVSDQSWENSVKSSKQNLDS
jgi:hypothetical protein